MGYTISRVYKEHFSYLCNYLKSFQFIYLYYPLYKHTKQSVVWVFSVQQKRSSHVRILGKFYITHVGKDLKASARQEDTHHWLPERSGGNKGCLFDFTNQNEILLKPKNVAARSNVVVCNEPNRNDSGGWVRKSSSTLSSILELKEVC